jgi:hypothetical protein
MKNRLIFCSLIISAAILSGCQKYDTVTVDDLDLVVTNYSKNADFSLKKTFAIPDSVVLVGEVEFDGSAEFLRPVYGDKIIATIKQNMIANGWIPVTKNQKPDVLLLTSFSQTTNIYYSYNYWGWYYPTGGYGWYYPGYYYPPTVSSYKTGSIFIQMTDVSDTNNLQLPVIWTSVVNGLAEGSAATIQARITTTINQSFKQSPYLKK